MKENKLRHYQCKDCGHELEIETNHEMECYPYCEGACRTILTSSDGRATMEASKQTTHIFVGEKE